jgi:hypothetical protein
MCLRTQETFLFHWLYSPLGPWSLLSVSWSFSDGRAPWTSDQLVARPLPKHRTTQTQNKHIHIPNIHVLCGIRTHDPSFRASEDSLCFRTLGYWDRQRNGLLFGRSLFVSRLEHKLCYLRFLWISSLDPGECYDRTSIKLQTLPAKFFTISFLSFSPIQ